MSTMNLQTFPMTSLYRPPSPQLGRISNTDRYFMLPYQCLSCFVLLRGQAIEVGNYWSGRAISSFKNPSPPHLRPEKKTFAPLLDPENPSPP